MVRPFTSSIRCRASIYAYDFDAREGSIANRRVLRYGTRGEGRPTGLAVDADGGVWCGDLDGWRVTAIGQMPAGSSRRTAVPRPTSVAFGGDDLCDFVSSPVRAPVFGLNADGSTASGGIFRPAIPVSAACLHRSSASEETAVSTYKEYFR